MGFNITRDKRRNHIAQVEIRQAAARYDSECGEVVTREPTSAEVERYNKIKPKRGLPVGRKNKSA